MLANYQKICQDDKFINYVWHCDNQKRQLYDTTYKEVEMLKASGATQKNSSKFAELAFNLSDLESELELRDFTNQAKSAMPKLEHGEFSCVGTDSCLRQKMIPKLFVDTLKVQSG